MSALVTPVRDDVAHDIERNKTFASVAADLGYVPGGHYSVAECQPYATQPQRDERGRFVKKGQTS